MSLLQSSGSRKHKNDDDKRSNNERHLNNVDIISISSSSSDGDLPYGVEKEEGYCRLGPAVALARNVPTANAATSPAYSPISPGYFLPPTDAFPAYQQYSPPSPNYSPHSPAYSPNSPVYPPTSQKQSSQPPALFLPAASSSSESVGVSSSSSSSSSPSLVSAKKKLLSSAGGLLSAPFNGDAQLLNSVMQIMKEYDKQFGIDAKVGNTYETKQGIFTIGNVYHLRQRRTARQKSQTMVVLVGLSPAGYKAFVHDINNTGKKPIGWVNTYRLEDIHVPAALQAPQASPPTHSKQTSTRAQKRQKISSSSSSSSVLGATCPFPASGVVVISDAYGPKFPTPIGPLPPQSHSWHYQDGALGWTPFDKSLQYLVETIYRMHEKCTHTPIKVQYYLIPHSYELDFATMTQINTKLGTQRCVQRTPNGPSSSSSMPAPVPSAPSMPPVPNGPSSSSSSSMPAPVPSAPSMPPVPNFAPPSRFVSSPSTLPKPPSSVNGQDVSALIRDAIKTVMPNVLPTHWTDNEGERTWNANSGVLTDLDASSAEFKEAVDMVHASCPTKNVTRVQKVVNSRWFINYRCWCEDLIARGIKINEVYAFHGTSEINIQPIVKSGYRQWFNVRSNYGRGTYFARDASFSLHPTYADVSHGSQFLFINRVCVGRIRQGNNNLQSTDGNFETAVDDVSDPTVYVTFDDNQSFAEFLVTVQDYEQPVLH